MNWWRSDPRYSDPRFSQIEPVQLQALTDKLDQLSVRLEAMEQRQIKP